MANGNDVRPEDRRRLGALGAIQRSSQRAGEKVERRKRRIKKRGQSILDAIRSQR